jgi:hypothetical protein
MAPWTTRMLASRRAKSSESRSWRCYARPAGTTGLTCTLPALPRRSPLTTQQSDALRATATQTAGSLHNGTLLVVLCKMDQLHCECHQRVHLQLPLVFGQNKSCSSQHSWLARGVQNASASPNINIHDVNTAVEHTTHIQYHCEQCGRVTCVHAACSAQ